MITKFEAKFAKDLRAIKEISVLNSVKDIIVECQLAENLTVLKQVKKLKGHTSFYRIRLGDYRLGIELFDNEIIFSRILHRKDIYRYFP